MLCGVLPNANNGTIAHVSAFVSRPRRVTNQRARPRVCLCSAPRLIRQRETSPRRQRRQARGTCPGPPPACSMQHATCNIGQQGATNGTGSPILPPSTTPPTPHCICACVLGKSARPHANAHCAARARLGMRAGWLVSTWLCTMKRLSPPMYGSLWPNVTPFARLCTRMPHNATHRSTPSRAARLSAV